MSQNSVWITGVGAATPLGHDYDHIADNLASGKSGIRSVSAFDVSGYSCRVAGLLDPLPTPTGWEDADFQALPPVERLHLWCIQQALQDAGHWPVPPEVRIGLVFGIGAEWLLTWEVIRQQRGQRTYDPEQESRSQLVRVQQHLGIQGPLATVGSACASANHALAVGRGWVQQGWVDVCVVGGGEMSVTPMGLGCFDNLRALSSRNAHPAQASRPFDVDRDGFVMGEGGVAFVLESDARACQRGAHPRAELAGFGASSDAFHPIIPSSNPGPAAGAIRQALADAQLNPDDLDYCNAHATSTQVGDIAETRVLQLALGPRARTIPVSSTKSMTGHLLAGAAAMNALACVVALERQALPPTINLDHIDPQCDLNHVANQARPHPVRTAASNAFGFGGSNTCIVLRRVA